jgi:enamine deaminase RidA (YjgF/YER057c/UK114 family)
MASDAESRLDELGVELPQAPAPAGAYVPATRTGNLVFTAGDPPFEGGELNILGNVGDAVGVDEAREATRLCAQRPRRGGDARRAAWPGSPGSSR